jgi:integrase
MLEHSIRAQIKKRSADAFGRHVWPHLFRAIAATGFVDHAPEDAALVPDLLGHASTQRPTDTTSSPPARSRTGQYSLPSCAGAKQPQRG